MSIFAVLYRGNGRIQRQVNVPTLEMLELNTAEDEVAIITEGPTDPERQCVIDGSIEDRSELGSLGYNSSVPQGTDIEISGVPEGTQVLWPDAVITVETDGTVICDTPYAGQYRFVFDHPHYLVQEVLIDVTA